jgi:rhamnogalacturonan endolyase
MPHPFRFSVRLASILLLTALTARAQTAPDVQVTLNGAPAKPGDYDPTTVQALTLSNGLLTATFGPDGSMTSLIKNGQELVHNLNGENEVDIRKVDPDRHRTWYIDYSAGGGHLLADVYRIVKVTPDLVNFAVIDNGVRSRYYLEYHIVMQRGVSGLYGYVILRAPNGGNLNELRTMFRFDRDIFDWAYNDERVGQQPRYGELHGLPQTGDETWVLPADSPYRRFTGQLYQKYDYSAYYAESAMFGHYGHGFGAFYIPVSTEYYGGGPLKQELIIHQDALILNYIQGEHYGAGNMNMPEGFEKLYGPWLVYINATDPKDPNSAGELIADGLKAAHAEQAKWPYAWMADEPLYQIKRTTVTGQLKVADGRSAAHAWVILAQPGDVYPQDTGYIYYVKADDTGKFTLPNVRPGNYALHAWATQGTITDELEKDNIAVQGDSLDLGTVLWTPTHHNHLLWQIGQADGMAGEFKYGNASRSRSWMDSVPANLTFTIGSSKDADDWYYAQGHPGNWDINFTLDQVPTGNAYLTVPVAGGSGTVNITVNGQTVGTINKGNDSSIARATMRSGVYQYNSFTFPASALQKGANTIRFSMPTAAGGSGLMYDTVILEGD